MIDIAPSILAADFARLGEHIDVVAAGGASMLHVDVMDGHFVPNISLGLPVVRSIAQHTRLPIDAHLMIAEPGRYATQFVEAGAALVSVHIEADPHLHRTVTAIKEKGAQAGVALNPMTPLASIEEIISFVDYVVIMSVNPGFGGQKFISTSLDKLRRLRAMIQERGLKTRIEIDGGVDRHNIAEVVAAGAQIVVAGSAIYGDADPAGAVRALRAATVQWA
ncbi:MAG: ribulose-phosphate 3-epimerase [Pyrinomonadaceae bacterium]